ncbi:MAG: preprotein translocase subunit SecY [Candidatus Nomurabacteria bacterium]|jgi:preprotein translocase subunit SecY|nr:preprotein translocase subunit SecY [Candidatus Nomurabacteria bacterium]
MNFKTILQSLRSKDMLKRVAIIFGIIIAYRLLAHIPVPLGDAKTFKDAVGNLITSSDFGGFLNLISGGGLTSFSIILVGLSPFITASIVGQLLTKAIPRLEELHKDGESGRRKINQWTRVLAVPLAILQSVAYIFILYQQVIAANTTTAVEPTTIQWILSITAMSAGSILLMWLGELITEQGIGNGISTIIFASIISAFPSTLAGIGTSLFDTSAGSLSLFGWFELPVNPATFYITLGLGVGVILVLYLLVKVNEAQRIVTINYAKRVHGNSAYGGIKSIMPIKLIAAGVVPVIFAVAFLSLPAFVGQLIMSADPGNQVASNLVSWFSAPSAQNFTGLSPEWFIYPICYFLLVVGFTFFYTSIIFNTKEIAENLQKQGGFIEGVRPGLETEKYFNRTVSRLNLFGALALGLIAMLPYITDYIFIVISGAPIGLSLSGTGLLIVVTVALESLRQLNSRALMVTYDEYK